MITALNQLNIPFTFTKRPAPLPGDLRPMWRIALLLLMLLHSRARKASFQKLHVLNWAVHAQESRQLVSLYFQGTIGKDQIVPRVEPSLNRAIDFARGEGLVRVENGRQLVLLDKGLAAAQLIEQTAECMDIEKAFLIHVKTFASERNIEDLLHWGLSS